MISLLLVKESQDKFQVRLDFEDPTHKKMFSFYREFAGNEGLHMKQQACGVHQHATTVLIHFFCKHLEDP